MTISTCKNGIILLKSISLPLLTMFATLHNNVATEVAMLHYNSNWVTKLQLAQRMLGIIHHCQTIVKHVIHRAVSLLSVVHESFAMLMYITKTC